jgi:hypothetical protein
VLDGSIAGTPDNLLIYATSNRRHLMPEYMHENQEATHIDGEVHPGEATEEKISLSERFGLWLSFYPFDQDHYLEHLRALAARVRTHAARSKSARVPTRCSGRCCAARAAAASRGSSRATTRAATRQAGPVKRSADEDHRGRRCRTWCGRTAASCSASARRIPSIPATGSFPAARSSRAKRRPRRWCANCTRNSASTSIRRLSVDRARAR